jgi:hypothetical protein
VPTPEPQISLTTTIDTTSIGLSHLIAALQGAARAIDPSTATVRVSSSAGDRPFEVSTSKITITGKSAVRPGGALRTSEGTR